MARYVSTGSTRTGGVRIIHTPEEIERWNAHRIEGHALRAASDEALALLSAGKLAEAGDAFKAIAPRREAHNREAQQLLALGFVA